MNKLLQLSSFKLTLAYIGVGVTALALFALPMGYIWRSAIDSARIKALQADTRKLAAYFQQEGAAGLARAIDLHMAEPAIDEEIVLLADPSMQRLAGNLPAWPPQVAKSAGYYVLAITLGDGSREVALVCSTLPGGYRLLVGRDIGRFKHVEDVFWYSLAGVAGVVLLIGGLGGMLIRRSFLAKVHDMSQVTAAIVAGNLSHRLPTHGGGNELDMLAQSFNRDADRIETLINSVRHGANAIAHDLRTPLALMRSRLESLLRNRPAAAETFSEIETAVGDADRIIGVFNALLRLAEIDSGARRSGFRIIDVARIALEAAEFYQPAAELEGIGLSFDGADELSLRGDPLLLAQAIGNLIDNAIKFAQKNGQIRVEVSRRPTGSIEIAVADDGSGIPDEEKPKVGERFYRGDASRSSPGNGLGLSLVIAVAKLHRGSLELADNHPGLRASLILGPPADEHPAGRPHPAAP